MNPILSPVQPGFIYAGPYFLPEQCLSEALAKILPTEISLHSFSKSGKS